MDPQHWWWSKEIPSTERLEKSVAEVAGSVGKMVVQTILTTGVLEMNKELEAVVDEVEIMGFPTQATEMLELFIEAEKEKVIEAEIKLADPKEQLLQVEVEEVVV